MRADVVLKYSSTRYSIVLPIPATAFTKRPAATIIRLTRMSREQGEGSSISGIASLTLGQC